MYSTRKAPKPPVTACSSRGAAADAEAAGDAEDAAAADAYTGVEAAVCHGALAASVKPDHVRSIDKCRLFWPGSTKSTRPNHVFWGRLLVSPTGGLAYEGRVDVHPYRKEPARVLGEVIAVVGEYALRRAYQGNARAT